MRHCTVPSLWSLLRHARMFHIVSVVQEFRGESTVAMLGSVLPS